jgi:hypothetical protein
VNPAVAEALWCVLCSYRSGFEGGGVAVGRPAAVVGRFEGVVDGAGGAVRDTVAVVATSCPRAPQQCRGVVTVPGVVQQRRGWSHRVDSDGDDRSHRPDVTAWSYVRTKKTFEGAAGPPSRAQRVSHTGVGSIVSGADTSLAAQCYTAAGMASPRELVEQCRDAIPERVKVAACVLRCQGIKRPYTRPGAWAACVQVSSSETVLAEGSLNPRARRTSPEG